MSRPADMGHVCPVCGSRRTRHWKDRSLDRPLIPEDLRITDHRYGVTLALSRCLECGFVFAEDGVSELTGLYERLDDPEYEVTQDTRLLQMQWLIRAARARRPAARTLLDVGAGAGLLVAEAARMGLDATGIEPSRSLVAAGRARHGVDLICGVLPHPALTGRRFDMVLLVDVIEHVADPAAMLRLAAAQLAPGGLLVVVTPDVGSVAARVLGERWWHLRLAHVGYFDARSFTRLAEVCGLAVRHRSRARWFFRVRYLAERVAEYLPVAWLNRAAARIPALQWLYDRVITVDLRDSFVLFLEASHA